MSGAVSPPDGSSLCASLLAIGLIERERRLSPIVLAAMGIWFLWMGISRATGVILFADAIERLSTARVERNKHRANVNDEGFHVSAENRSWICRWSDVSPKGEDQQVFLFFSPGSLFIFAKRYWRTSSSQLYEVLPVCRPASCLP